MYCGGTGQRLGMVAVHETLGGTNIYPAPSLSPPTHYKLSHPP